MNNEEIKKLLESLLKSIPLVLTDIKILENSPEITLFSIETPESGLLIGNNGETLLALNHLIKRAAEKKADTAIFKRSIAIDVNEYRKKNEERIKGIVAMLGERAVSLKHEVVMDPMGAYERRVVHSFFQDHPHLVTESHGFGGGRHIVIKYTENKSFNKKIENEEGSF